MDNKNIFKSQKPLILDGAMGTMLQKKGLRPGDPPELMNLTQPELVEEIHREYILAGSNVIYTNTFGASSRKMAATSHTGEEVIPAAVKIARRAAAGTAALVALDIGPIGELLEPSGSLAFEEAVDCFRRQMVLGIGSGADFIAVETLSDLYEAKAAVLAAKEACSIAGRDVPVVVTMTFDQTFHTFTGCSVSAMALTLGGLGADAIGFNCSLGPVELLPLAKELCKWTSLPIFIKPNAGLPNPETGLYNITQEGFAREMLPFAELGVAALGGCCGTNPAYISSLKKILKNQPPVERSKTEYAYLPRAAVCTPTTTVEIDGVKIIGERINPTGKKLLRQAILDCDMDYIITQGSLQLEAGADILDINMGLPEIDEAKVLPLVVSRLQSALTAPLQIDSSNPLAVEAALRIYNGKAIVNSVSGERAAMSRLFPIVKRYGAAVIGLTLDEHGIPDKAEDRLSIAKTIVETASSYGIPREDVYIDCLALTASVEQDKVGETLKAIRLVKEELGVKTLLGISNISFGLPNRELINRSFLLLALEAGLDLPIMNPSLAGMTDAISAYNVLSNRDPHSAAFIDKYKSFTPPIVNVGLAPGAGPTAAAGPTAQPEFGSEMETAISRGLPETVRKLTLNLLEHHPAQELISTFLIPSLDKVGQRFEAGEIFLPQLIQSSRAAQAAFEVIKASLPPRAGGAAESWRERGILLASVKGDIHDIGKNIVKVILENYGYRVFDLGMDVSAETIVAQAARTGVKLVGLSALMTTTLKSMEETISAIHNSGLTCKVMVGGAVLTPAYAQKIGADFYAKDAKQSADIAREVFEG